MRLSHLYRVASFPRTSKRVRRKRERNFLSQKRDARANNVSSPCRVDEILNCWDESWESFIETRKTHQFPGISDRSILQRQQHHCAQSHWRWRMKTPFNNIAYSGASAPVQTFFARGEMIDCIRAHRSRSQNCTRTGDQYTVAVRVFFVFRVTSRGKLSLENNSGVKVRDATNDSRCTLYHLRSWLHHKMRRYSSRLKVIQFRWYTYNKYVFHEIDVMYALFSVSPSHSSILHSLRRRVILPIRSYVARINVLDYLFTEAYA